MLSCNRFYGAILQTMYGLAMSLSLFEMFDTLDILRLAEHDENITIFYDKISRRYKNKVVRNKLLDGDDMDIVFRAQIQIDEAFPNKFLWGTNLDQVKVFCQRNEIEDIRSR